MLKTGQLSPTAAFFDIIPLMSVPPKKILADFSALTHDNLILCFLQIKKNAEEYFSNLFDNDLAKMHAQSKAQAEKARKFARAFRFLCPSRWIPGKQKWGAF